MTDSVLFKEESFEIIGACMEVHNNLGIGFSEIVYKDALVYEFTKRLIPFEREREYIVRYKEIVLPHKFYADFIVFDKIILEVKCCSQLANEHTAQCLNYLKVSNNQLALLVNFGELRLKSKRVVL
ncbi:GxxExxY protein [Niabella ginsengisoli]|uniref:GxxExxY protein n=1 Tax=Niabella ginsengisoli TaxID=522298 RepID=A0ABS9SEG1_9BACT|nr:GxxExxY protein [Niabella ginsengisoli]MCH5596744.1 GxxExxY protein [Niabella ginsengisoli]